MTNLGNMNDNYYQPADSTGWDYFVDYAESNGIEPTEEAFEEWEDMMRDAAEDAAIARAEEARDAWLDGDY